MRKTFPLGAGLALASASFCPAGEVLRVRATAAVAPCVAAVARAHPAHRAQVETGSVPGPAPADVLAASAVELTRALEKGEADLDSDVDLARIPWVLSAGAGPLAVGRLEDLREQGVEVWVPTTPDAYEARRALELLAPGRVRPAADTRALGQASLALVPLSLAGPGPRIPVDVPPLVARAAVSAHTRRPEAARAFVRLLASEAGRRCGAGTGSKP
jgi:extracellular solute-binding protein